MNRRVKLALVFVGVVVAVLALAEVGARVFGPLPPPPNWESHLLVGFVRAPNYRTNKVAIDTGEPFVYETNALGLRSTTLNAVPKPAGKKRIVFVGGSTTENGDLPHEHTFPGIVEAKLKDRGVEVANAGVPGATTSVALAQLVHRVLPLQPDVVVCLDPVVNDFHESLTSGWDPLLQHMAAAPSPPSFMDWLTGASRLLTLLDTRHREPVNAKEVFARRSREHLKNPPSDPPDDLLLRGVPRFELAQRVMLEVLRDEKIVALVVTEPILVKPVMTKEEDEKVTSAAVPRTDFNLRPETELRALAAYDEVTRRNAEKLGAYVVEGSVVPKDLAHFVDDVHLSTKGNEALAEAILAKVVPLVSKD
ncbi:MAG TPA: hypothetical protein VFF73_26960 [Planctomycetota bacterium]|nr:hypothetical protein [Planctomycetota bacterium]